MKINGKSSKIHGKSWVSSPRWAKVPSILWAFRGWEGGLGSPAFHALALRLAALVFIIATAQTARKYLGQLQAPWPFDTDFG